MQLAFAQALVCALIFFGLWALRLGFLANFLSRAVLIGFISGLGIEVFTSQIPKMLGICVEGEEWLDKVVGIVQGIQDTNVYAAVRRRRHVRHRFACCDGWRRSCLAR